ncbi:MAG: ABC transporter ATP-binding protein [Candidatus Krumholzibacteria bacterium]|nr:ABC transporter ATP-binding protein [Candidatus Krumholzibacteria bacterium]
MIEVEGLTKYYGSRAAVKDVSFRAEKGEILGFLGPNGAGKTTTMRILTCFLPPTAGTARIAGYDIQDESRAVRQRVGYLPENVPLYDDLTVAAYLDFVGTLKGLTRARRIEHVGAVMEECGIEEVRVRPIGTLSRGFRQRVGLAQALLGDPEVLILDEPTVGLDPKQIIEIRDLIKGLAGKRTVILSTHILPEVSLTCTRVVIINEGKVVANGTPDNLHSRFRKQNRLIAVVRGPGAEVKKRLKSVRGVKEVREKTSDSRAKGKESGDDPQGVHEFQITARDASDPRSELARAVVEGGYDLLELRSTGMSLEDVFLQTIAAGESDGNARGSRKRD